MAGSNQGHLPVRSVSVLSPVSSLGGRRFEPRAELSLHGLAELAASTLPGVPEDVLLIPEMPSPLGLPDFVALAGGQTWLRERHEVGIPPILAEADCTVLAALHAAQPFTSATVAQRIGWTRAEVDVVIARLEKVDAVLTTAGGAHRINSALVPRGSLIALEAKVKDWQKAILQGRAYRTWANNYVVLLGEVGNVAAERAREGVVSDGAGLYSASGWVVRPRPRKPAPAKRLRGFEYLFAAVASSAPAL